MGKASRDKGARGELEFAKHMEGTKRPLSGALGGEYGNDVGLQNGWQIEVKRFKEGEKTLYGWIEDQREKPDAVAFRADRKPWVVAMLSTRFKALVDVQIAARNVLILTEDGLPLPGRYDEYTRAVDALSDALNMSTRDWMQLEQIPFQEDDAE